MKYPSNWFNYIVPEILKRAGNHCEKCGVRNHAMGYRDECGVFHEVTRSEALTCKEDLVTINLDVAHVDHDVTNNDLMDHQGPALPRHQSNLRALCAFCQSMHILDKTRKAFLKKASRKNVEDDGQQELELGI